MSTLEWAKKEVELLNNKEDDTYFNECCKSALKAFTSLCEDGHSGLSINVTKNILNKLIEGIPLSPIEDTEDVWSDVVDKTDDYVCYQCNRKSSLFKYVYTDGTVKYTDVDRVICVNVNNPNEVYTNGVTRKLIDDKYPITMPYSFTGRYKVYCEEFLVDEKNGDFDTVGILYVILPNGERYDINEFKHEYKGNMIKIDNETYNRYKKIAETKERFKRLTNK